MPTILFVQNNSADGEGIRSALADQGWHVNMASNAGEALRSAAKHAPNLVLVDGALAEAPSLLKSFSLGNGGPGAVVISPGTSSDMSDVAKPPEADDILQRPFTPGDLIELASRRLSTPRKTQGEKSAVRGEVLNAQQIFGGILDELDDDEPETDQLHAPQKEKKVRRSAASPAPKASATESFEAITVESSVSRKKAAPDQIADSPGPQDDLEDRLNRAMEQALEVAEEVSSTSNSVSQVDTFKNLDQEIEDQLAGVLSQIEHPETAKPSPAATTPVESQPKMQATEPPAKDAQSVEATSEQLAASSSTSLIQETTEATSRKHVETSGQASLHGAESSLEHGLDSTVAPEESEEYKTVGLESLPQKKKIAAIGASAALVIAIVLFFWFRGGQQEAASLEQADSPQQQEFQPEYPPSDQEDAALTGGDGGGAESPDSELSDGMIDENSGTSPASDSDDSSKSSEASDNALNLADHDPPPVTPKTDPKKSLPAQSAARDSSASNKLSDQSSISRKSPVVPDRVSAGKPFESSQNQPVQRQSSPPSATSQTPAQRTVADSPGPTESTGSGSITTQPPARRPTPTAKPPTTVRQSTSSATVTEETSSQTAPAPKKLTPPPKRAVKRGDLVRRGPGVVVPTLVNLPSASYPAVARKLKLEGAVTLSILVNEDGRVQEVKVIKPPAKDRGFSEAATRAARGARFKAATKDGVEVKFWHSVTIRFEL